MEFKVVLNVINFFQLFYHTVSMSSLWFKGTLLILFLLVCTWLFHEKNGVNSTFWPFNVLENLSQSDL